MSLNPTIILGIGSFGGKVVNHLRTLVYEELDKPGLPIFRFAHISTHSDNDKIVPKPANQDGDESWEFFNVLHCTQKADHTIRIKSHLGRSGSTGGRKTYEPGWKEWLDDRLLKRSNLAFEHGAGSVRMIGRCLLWNNWNKGEKVKNRLSRFVQDITNTGRTVLGTNEILRQYYHRKGVSGDIADNLVGNEPRVYIITTLCGGTGSGMFLDLSYFFREMTDASFKIFGMFAVPDTTTCEQPGKHRRYAANALAALTELDFYMDDATKYSAHFPMEINPLTSKEPPFNYIQLFSCKNKNNEMLGDTPVPGENAINELAYIVAGNMFYELLSGTDGIKAGVHIDHFAGHPEWRLRKKEGDGFLRVLSSFGGSTAHYPKYRIAGAAASQLILLKVLEWTGKEVRRSVSGGIEERKKDKKGLQPEVIANNWLRRALDVGFQKFSLGRRGTVSLEEEWTNDFHSHFYQADGKLKRFSAQGLKNQLSFAPNPKDPFISRFVSGSAYYNLLQTRLETLRTAIFDSLNSSFNDALAAIVSERTNLPEDMPQDLEDLQEVISKLSLDAIQKVKEMVPPTPTSSTDLKPLKGTFDIFEQADNSLAVAVLPFCKGAIREHYQELIINQFKDLLNRTQKQLIRSFLAEIIDEIKREIEIKIKDKIIQLNKKISECISMLKEQYNNLVHFSHHENLVLVFNDRQTGIIQEVKECQELFTEERWGEIILSIERTDRHRRKLKDIFLDPRSDHRAIIDKLTDQMVRMLMGHMVTYRPMMISNNLIEEYPIELETMGRRSSILLEIVPNYYDIFMGDQFRLICGGEDEANENVRNFLNRKDIYEFDDAQSETSMNHMLHLYQEEAGMAVDDLSSYSLMKQHYNLFIDDYSDLEPEKSILHIHKDPLYFQIAPYLRINELTTDKGSGRPSPFRIATKFIYDKVFTWRPKGLDGEEEALFEWEDPDGVADEAIYDEKDPDSFLMEIAQDPSACNSFKRKVRDEIEQMDTKDIVDRRNKIISKINRDNRKEIEGFKKFFNNEFVNKEGFPWWVD